MGILVTSVIQWALPLAGSDTAEYYLKSAWLSRHRYRVGCTPCTGQVDALRAGRSSGAARIVATAGRRLRGILPMWL